MSSSNENVAVAVTHTSTCKSIVTHNGTFHCDEVLAVHMLRHTTAYSNASLIRTRDPVVINAADIVVDVGAIYDPAAHRFDHHQRGFDKTFADSGSARTKTKLSSAGLVYKHFGPEIVAAVLSAKHQLTLVDDDLQTVYLKVYDAFVEAIDAVDNGVPQYDTDKPPNYESNTSLSSRVAQMNPEWNQPSTPEIQDQCFANAVRIVGLEFDDCVARVARSWLPARAIIHKAMSIREEDDEHGRLLVLREWAPWKDHLFTSEQEELATGNRNRPVQYVVYKDVTGGSWRVQAVPVNKSSFSSRTPLPDAWRGLRDHDLSQVAGIDGCIFAHASGFIGGNKTFDGALEMARKSLQISDKKNN